MVQLDLSIAFDTVELSKILPSKMKFYGFDQNSVEFFRSFFQNRYHFADWNGTESQPIPLLNHSVTQGSSISSFFYNLYTQDIQNVTDCICVNFADDLCMLFSNYNKNVLVKLINEELAKIAMYMKENTLIINEKKSVHLMFKPKGIKDEVTNESPTINGAKIRQVQNTKFLGVWFDDKLKFDKQYEMVSKKLENTVRALICVKDSLNFKSKMLVYNSLFRSHIDYCSISYLDRLNKSQLNELSKLQKNAVRLIFSARRNTHTGKLFRLAKIRPIENVYKEEATKFVLKYINDINKEHPRAIERILFKGNLDKRGIRAYDDESKIKIHHDFKKGNCIFNILDAWNQNDKNIRMAGNTYSLKKMLDEKIEEEATKCEIKNCFSCKIDAGRNYESYMKS